MNLEKKRPEAEEPGAHEEARTANPTVAEPRPAVRIAADGDLAEVVDALEAALIEAGAPIYQRAGELVRVVDGEPPRRGLKRDPAAPVIAPFTDVALQVEITRHVEIWRPAKSAKAKAMMRRVDCPLELARALRHRGTWKVGALAGVVEHPVVLPDGRVLWTNGYHAETGLLFHAPPDTYHAPHGKPTKGAAARALAKLRELLAGFPFVAPVDESVAVALLLTMFVRPVVATSPAFSVNATAPGTGKSFLVRLASIVASGREPALMTASADPKELQKLLFAALLQGDEHIAIDNVVGVLDSPALNALLTAPRYQDRVLGVSKTASAPNAAVVSINGNNLVIAGDLTRRVLECRLDAQCERPAERRFAFDPTDKVRQSRAVYVAAAVTVLQAYAQQRADAGVDLAPFGSFEDWSAMVREALVWHGMPDPCESMRNLEAEDPERSALGAMLAAVGAAFGESEWLVGDLLGAVDGGRQAKLAGERAVSPDAAAALREALRRVCERNNELSAKACGWWLRKVERRVVDNARFVKVREDRLGALWRREAVA